MADDWLDFELAIGDQYAGQTETDILDRKSKSLPTIYFIHVWGEVGGEQYDSYDKVIAPPNINTYDDLHNHVFLLLQRMIINLRQDRANDAIRREVETIAASLVADLVSEAEPVEDEQGEDEGEG